LKDKTPLEEIVIPDNAPPTLLPSSASRMAVDVYSISLAVVAVLAVVYTLHWAQAVFIPLMLGVMISYALTAPVNLLQK
jgi:predicted PurR-regulated permease PerM